MDSLKKHNFLKFMKKNILDLSLKNLIFLFSDLKFEKFRSQQLCNWIYKKRVFDFSKMTNFSREIQIKLAKYFEIYVPTIENVSISEKDKSYKFLLKACDGKLIEAILMISSGRATVCVSCMIGCPLKCSFCATGSELGYIRKLTAGEIIGQVLLLEKYAKDNKLANRISNIVFMGMGEPFLNLDAVSTAIENLLDPNLFGISRYKITVSTAGVGRGIADFVNKYKIKLAVSIHFPNNELRSRYMPINNVFPLENLIQELQAIKLGKRDYITIEYIMLDGINDQIENAKQLLRLLSNLKVKFNLIPYNPTKKLAFKPSSEDAINKFANYLKSKSFMVTVRRSYGVDIEGGCGQFALFSTTKC